MWQTHTSLEGLGIPLILEWHGLHQEELEDVVYVVWEVIYATMLSHDAMTTQNQIIGEKWRKQMN